MNKQETLSAFLYLLQRARHLECIITRNTLDCDQSNVHSSRAVFSAIS